jgi:hypothetical protein
MLKAKMVLTTAQPQHGKKRQTKAKRSDMNSKNNKINRQTQAREKKKPGVGRNSKPQDLRKYHPQRK